MHLCIHKSDNIDSIRWSWDKWKLSCCSYNFASVSFWIRSDQHRSKLQNFSQLFQAKLEEDLIFQKHTWEKILGILRQLALKAFCIPEILPKNGTFCRRDWHGNKNPVFFCLHIFKFKTYSSEEMDFSLPEISRCFLLINFVIKCYLQLKQRNKMLRKSNRTYFGKNTF